MLSLTAIKKCATLDNQSAVPGHTEVAGILSLGINCYQFEKGIHFGEGILQGLTCVFFNPHKHNPYTAISKMQGDQK